MASRGFFGPSSLTLDLDERDEFLVVLGEDHPREHPHSGEFGEERLDGEEFFCDSVGFFAE